MACGRRWGKSKYFGYRMSKVALDGKRYGYFAPDYKKQMEVFREASHRLSPAASRIRGDEKSIELVTGGAIDFWTLNDPDAGRSREYDEVGIDEAGLVPNLWQIWTEAIRATLLDRNGKAIFGGTPKGRNGFYTAYALGLDPQEPDWESFHFPTWSRPNVRPEEIEAMRHELSERAFQQEVEAIFLDEAGGVFSRVRECVMPVPEKPQAPFYAGVDLARTTDYCVVSILDANGRQVYLDRWNRTTWEVSITRILRAASMFPGVSIWVDSTGVGDPIYERLRHEYQGTKSYKFTAESKRELIENLVLRIERKEIGIMDDPVQIAELLSYEYQIGKTGHISMNAPEGMHDDCVIALALAAWPLREMRRVKWDLY